MFRVYTHDVVQILKGISQLCGRDVSAVISSAVSISHWFFFHQVDGVYLCSYFNMLCTSEASSQQHMAVSLETRSSTASFGLRSRTCRA